MKQFWGCDAHKKYSVFVAMDETGKKTKPTRVPHDLEAYRHFLTQLPEHSHIAIEATGHWYWIVDEMERARHIPHLTDALEAKKRVGKTHKSDPIDAGGLSLLLRCGTLPEVWIPPAPLRDQREMLRTRMALRDLRTALKHRIHAAIDRYNLYTTDISDLFGLRSREYLNNCLAKPPPVTASMIVVQLDALDQLEIKIEALEKRIRAEIASTPAVRRLMTLPGVADTLGPVIAFEIGDVARFSRAECLASYAGLVPRLISSGDRIHHGRTPERKINPFLKWAFVEAAVCSLHHTGPCYAHVKTLFARLIPTKGFGRAVVAMARHLAEASFWMLSKNQDYRPPQPPRLAPQQQATVHGDFVAGLKRSEQSGGNGGHAGRGDDSGFGAFEGSDFLLRHGESGIAVTRVDVSLVLALGPKFHFLSRRKGKSGRADNLRHDGAVDAAAIGLAAVNGLRLRAELCGLAGFHLKSVHLGGEQKQPPNWHGV